MMVSIIIKKKLIKGNKIKLTKLYTNIGKNKNLLKKLILLSKQKNTLKLAHK